jgi:hypothetical protein
MRKIDISKSNGMALELWPISIMGKLNCGQGIMLHLNAIFDGEMVVLYADGKPNFCRLINGENDGLVFYVLTFIG